MAMSFLRRPTGDDATVTPHRVAAATKEVVDFLQAAMQAKTGSQLSTVVEQRYGAEAKTPENASTNTASTKP